jgi:ribose/xylose/arabinose/galactoside ABC-type transport system permease subunit
LARSTTRLLGLLGALGLLLAVGLANDLLTVKLGAPSLVATLPAGLTIRGVSCVLTHGAGVYPLAREVTMVGAQKDLLSGHLAAPTCQVWFHRPG